MGNEGSKGRFTDSSEENEAYHEREREKLYFDSDEFDKSSREPSPIPLWERQKTEKRFKYNDESDDDREYEYNILRYELDGTRLKIRDCFWEIEGFEGTDVVEKKGGFIRSHLFVTGPCNTFQFFLEMHNQITENDTQYGVYACTVNNVRSNAKIHYESMILDHKNRKCLLDKENSGCPKKSGLRFLGYLSKERIIEDDYYNCSYIGEGELKLRFKIDVEYNTSYISEINYLEKLLDENKNYDVELVVKGKKFLASRKILEHERDVFEKLFTEKKSKIIEINDIDPEVMHSLLHYLHTKKVLNLFCLADKLLLAARKYNLKDLIAICKKV